MSLTKIIEGQKDIYRHFCFSEIEFQEEISEATDEFLEENLLLLVSQTINLDDLWFWIGGYIQSSNFLVSPPESLERKILSRKVEERENYMISLPKRVEISQNTPYLNLDLTLLERLLFEIVYPGYLGRDKISICKYSLYIGKNFPDKIFSPTVYSFEGQLVLDKILIAG